MEAHIVGYLDVLDSDLPTAIFVENFVGLMYHICASFVEAASDSAQEFIERDLTILVSIEVFHDLGDLKLRKVQTVVSHCIFEFDWAERSIAVAVHGFEHDSHATNAICTPLLAKSNDFLFNFLKVADLAVLLHVRVTTVLQVGSLLPSEFPHCFLFFKVNVAFVANHSFGLVEWLCKATSLGEWVNACCSTHVSVFPLEGFSIDRDRPSLRVISLWHSSSEFIISS